MLRNNSSDLIKNLGNIGFRSKLDCFQTGHPPDKLSKGDFLVPNLKLKTNINPSQKRQIIKLYFDKECLKHRDVKSFKALLVNIFNFDFRNQNFIIDISDAVKQRFIKVKLFTFEASSQEINELKILIEKSIFSTALTSFNHRTEDQKVSKELLSNTRSIETVKATNKIENKHKIIKTNEIESLSINKGKEAKNTLAQASMKNDQFSNNICHNNRLSASLLSQFVDYNENSKNESLTTYEKPKDVVSDVFSMNIETYTNKDNYNKLSLNSLYNNNNNSEKFDDNNTLFQFTYLNDFKQECEENHIGYLQATNKTLSFNNFNYLNYNYQGCTDEIRDDQRNLLSNLILDNQLNKDFKSHHAISLGLRPGECEEKKEARWLEITNKIV